MNAPVQTLAMRDRPVAARRARWAASKGWLDGSLDTSPPVTIAVSNLRLSSAVVSTTRPELLATGPPDCETTSHRYGVPCNNLLAHSNAASGPPRSWIWNPGNTIKATL